MIQQELLRGTVEAIVYQNAENGYTVLRIRSEDGELCTLVGIIPMPIIGEGLCVTGQWVTHGTYGRQMEAEYLEREMPKTQRNILSYLSSHAVKGVGEKIAERIVDKFGADSLSVLENEPERLAEIPGVSRAKALEISESFHRQTGMRRLMEYLTAHGLPAPLAVRLYRVYGELSTDALCDDPYLLVDPLFDADFVQVDAFAIRIGVEADDPRRVEAGMLYELSYNLGNGHTFIPREKLICATMQLLNLDRETVSAALTRLWEQERMIVDDSFCEGACYLPAFYDAETVVARRILKMTNSTPDVPKDLDGLLTSIARQASVSYDEHQIGAIRAAAERQILIVTGGPGTGKTTTMSGILHLFQMMGLKTQLAAPTGRAAKRLGECTGQEAMTIHRLLECQFDPESGALIFFHNEDEPLKLDALIVDETSMVDILLMRALLSALPQTCRLVLVGDPDQLPSVGAGNVFSDLIRCGMIDTIRLTEIFRQARESLIVMNAHAVNAGELPVLTATDRDFFFLRRREDVSVVQTIGELCAKRLPNKLGIRPDEIQVLSPTRKNATGTRNLNRTLQAALNPPTKDKREKQFSDMIFREGDRVMQIRNNYGIPWKKIDGTGSGVGIFNGDIGKIEQIDFRQEIVTVIYDDRAAEYEFSMLSDLEEAYAITVHKSQGSEYRAVILAVCSGAPMLFCRNVLYTAITRAKELLIVVGREDVLAEMVRNSRQTRRYSGLKLRLEKGVDSGTC